MSRAFLFVRLRYLAELLALWCAEGLLRRGIRLRLAFRFGPWGVVLLSALGCLAVYVLVMGWLLFGGRPYGR